MKLSLVCFTVILMAMPAFGLVNEEQSAIHAKIEACRVALRDIEKMRPQATTLGNVELFDDLFLSAEQVLLDIEKNQSPSEMYYLLGQCQGILDSLTLALNPGKYRGKSKESYGTAPQIMHTAKDKNQAVARPNSVTLEPLAQLSEDEKAHERRAQNVSVNHKRSTHSAHDDHLLEN